MRQHIWAAAAAPMSFCVTLLGTQGALLRQSDVTLGFECLAWLVTLVHKVAAGAGLDDMVEDLKCDCLALNES